MDNKTWNRKREIEGIDVEIEGVEGDKKTNSNSLTDDNYKLV